MTTKQSETPVEPPPSLHVLVDRFADHVESYRAGRYNETQLRREFIDPLLKLLGWDVDNERGYAEAYKEVIHEDAIKIGGVTKAPDYCCRIGGTRKFFVEAKKPSVDIKGDPAPAYQLRRYAWSAKLPLSILTDFEELAVYDCRIKPAKTDPASTARILYMRYMDYASEWGTLSSVFSGEAILRGAFDKFAESKRKKRGTAEVDDAFLTEIELWRAELARNFALRNPDLEQRDLNFAVQRTIDRILFLRICEDRGIEEYGALRSLAVKKGVYRRLFDYFRRADERYNSGLFHFSLEKGRNTPPDELTTALILDDKPIKTILTRLYYPDSPYEFSVLPAEILGHVYERFLGKVVRLTKSHQAKVEERPEVRKAGGVYYTPSYIVDYIVMQTVGKLLEGKSPRAVGGLTPQWRPAKNKTPLSILDPACGSGSFLLGAYQFLLNWYRDRYVEEGPEDHARGRQPRLFQHPSGEWRLTSGERKRILLSHIHGVDIDAQAVEVTKLSLLLKVLEGESEESLTNQLTLFRERALPDLEENIKCGNALVGPDFYNTQESDLFGGEDRHRINAFDWNNEFPVIMAAGGFDIVIGNPPWGQKDIGKVEPLTRYLRAKFSSLAGIFDLFRPFVEQGIRILRQGGHFGQVLPDTILLKNYEASRRFLLENVRLQEIDWWGMAFPGVVIDAATVVGVRVPSSTENVVTCTIRDVTGTVRNRIPQSQFWRNERLTFNLFLSEEKRTILQYFSRSLRLGDEFEIHEGVHSGNIRSELFVEEWLDESCEPLLLGRDEIAPYSLKWNGKYVRLSAAPTARSKERYANTGRRHWYQQDKILVRRTGDYVLAAVDRRARYASNNFFVLFPRRVPAFDLDAICAILNSPLMTWYFRTIEPRRGRVFAEIKIKHLETFPLPSVRRDDPRVASLAQLATQRSDNQLELLCGRNPGSREQAKRHAKYLDDRIAMLVYDIYSIPAESAQLIQKEIGDAGIEEREAV